MLRTITVILGALVLGLVFMLGRTMGQQAADKAAQAEIAAARQQVAALTASNVSLATSNTSLRDQLKSTQDQVLAAQKAAEANLARDASFRAALKEATHAPSSASWGDQPVPDAVRRVLLSAGQTDRSNPG